MLCNNFKAKRLQNVRTVKLIQNTKNKKQKEKLGEGKKLNKATNASLLLFANGKCLPCYWCCVAAMIRMMRIPLNWGKILMNIM